MPRKNNPRQASDQVSELTAGRLSLYLRSLNVLDAAGVKTVSSKALAEQFHLNAAQILKDLAYFGEFGIRGVPFFVLDGKYGVSGAQESATFVNILEQVVQERAAVAS